MHQQHDSTTRFADRLIEIAPAIHSLGVDGACVVAELKEQETKRGFFARRLICRDDADAHRQLARVLSRMSERGLVALYATWTRRWSADRKEPVVVTLDERRKIETEETHGDPERAKSLRRILAVKLREAHKDGRPVHYEATAQERPETVAAAAE
jgi:hypothetical protein